MGQPRHSVILPRQRPARGAHRRDLRPPHQRAAALRDSPGGPAPYPGDGNGPGGGAPLHCRRRRACYVLGTCQGHPAPRNRHLRRVHLARWRRRRPGRSGSGRCDMAGCRGIRPESCSQPCREVVSVRTAGRAQERAQLLRGRYRSLRHRVPPPRLRRRDPADGRRRRCIRLRRRRTRRHLRHQLDQPQRPLPQQRRWHLRRHCRGSGRDGRLRQGQRRLRGGLRQRRRQGPLRHQLRRQQAVPQQRRRHVRKRHRGGWPGRIGRAVQVDRVRMGRLRRRRRPGLHRAALPVRDERPGPNRRVLHRLGRAACPEPQQRRRDIHQRHQHPRRYGSARPGGLQEPPGRHDGTARSSNRQRLGCRLPGGMARFRQRWRPRSLRGQRLGCQRPAQRTLAQRRPRRRRVMDLHRHVPSPRGPITPCMAWASQ